MAVNLATGFIDLVPTASGIGKRIADELDLDTVATQLGKSAGEKLSQGVLAGAQDTGKKLATALGLAALGAIAVKSAIDVEDAQNTIIRTTGATGKAAAGLEESFRNVASTTSASFETVSSTLAQLYQRTGLQGKALEGLTSQVVSFNRQFKDSPITVDALTKALAGFNVPGDRMGTVLDHLFVISQKTGVPLAELLGTLQTAGPLARQFGLSVEDTASFLAQLNKAGIDANQILPGLKKVFKDAADAGQDPQQALRGIITQIDDLVKAGDQIGARNLAVQVFGPRGVGLVDAALAGKLSLDDLNKSVAVTGDGILQTGQKTGTLSGALGILRNNLQLALAEFAKPAINAANDALRAILPTVRDIASGFASLPDPVKIGAVALVGLSTQLGNIGQFAEGLEAIKSLGGGIATGFQLAAVRGLELVDSLKAITLTGALATGALTLGFAAIAAGIVIILTSADKLGPGFAAAEVAGKRLASSVLAGARASGNEVKTLETQIKSLDAGITTLQKDLDRRTNGSVELQAESDAATQTALSLKQLHTERDILNKRLDEAKQAQHDEAAAARETAASLDQYTRSTEAGTNASSALAHLTDDAKKALADLQSALLQAAGGEIGYQQSVIARQKAQDTAQGTFLAVLSAQQNLNDAVAQYGPDSEQARAAQDALTQAQRDNTEASLNLRQAQLNEATAVLALTDNQQNLFKSLNLAGKTRAEQLGIIDAEIAKVQASSDANAQSAESLKPVLFGLVDLKQKIEAVPTEHNTNVTANVDQALAAIAQVDAGLASALTGATQDQARAILQGIAFASLAGGGIVDVPTSGAPAMLHGHEAVLPLSDPRRSWTIIAQAGLLSAMVPAPAAGRSGALIEGGLHIHAPIDDPVQSAVTTSRSLRALSVLESL